MKNIIDFIKRGEKFHRNANPHHDLAKLLHSASTHCPFFTSGVCVYILGPFVLVPIQLKFLIIGVDHFTKWIEVEDVSKIMT